MAGRRVVFMAALCVLWVLPAGAATYTWQGAGTGGNTSTDPADPSTQWSQLANWEQGSVPGSKDTAVVAFANAGYACGGGTVTRLDLSGPGTLYLGAASSMSVSGDCSIGYLTDGSALMEGGQHSLGQVLIGNGDTMEARPTGWLDIQGGTLNARYMMLGVNGGAGYVTQSGNALVRAGWISMCTGDYTMQTGTVQTDWLNVSGNYNTTFQVGGGTLDVGECHVGDYNILGGSGQLIVHGSLSMDRGTFSGGADTDVYCGPDSIALFPTGFDPYTAFKSYVSEGITHVRGSTLEIPADKTVTFSSHGFGDFISVRGTLNMGRGSLNLFSGLRVHDGGCATAWQVNAEGPDCGLDDGTLNAAALVCEGHFDQTGGSLNVSHTLYVQSRSQWNPPAEFIISGGNLVSARIEVAQGLSGGAGAITQTGGTVTAASVLLGGCSREARYDLHDGRLVCDAFSMEWNGTFRLGGGTSDCLTVQIASGRLEIADSSAVLKTGQITFGDGAIVSAVPGSTIDVVSTNPRLEIQGTQSFPARLAGLANTTFVMRGGLGSIEAACRDVGLDPAGWEDWAVIGGLTVGAQDAASTGLATANWYANFPEGGTEAVYVEELAFAPGGYIRSESPNLYYRNGGEPKRFYRGDATLDGVVDVGDLGVLAANWGRQQGGQWSLGDFNGDHIVNVGDLGVLATHWGLGVSQQGSNPVPEPGCLLLLGAVTLGLPRHRRPRA